MLFVCKYAVIPTVQNAGLDETPLSSYNWQDNTSYPALWDVLPVDNSVFVVK